MDITKIEINKQAEKIKAQGRTLNAQERQIKKQLQRIFGKAN